MSLIIIIFYIDIEFVNFVNVRIRGNVLIFCS